jgi:hypothetical protein
VATSTTLCPRSVTCLSAYCLNSSVYRLLLINTPLVAIFYGFEMSSKLVAIQIALKAENRQEVIEGKL